MPKTNSKFDKIEPTTDACTTSISLARSATTLTCDPNG